MITIQLLMISDLKIQVNKEEVIPTRSPKCEAHFKSDKPHGGGRGWY